MPLDRLNSIGGAGGIEPACLGWKERGDNPLVCAYQNYEHGYGRMFIASIAPIIRTTSDSISLWDGRPSVPDRRMGYTKSTLIEDDLCSVVLQRMDLWVLYDSRIKRFMRFRSTARLIVLETDIPILARDPSRGESSFSLIT